MVGRRLALGISGNPCRCFGSHLKSVWLLICAALIMGLSSFAIQYSASRPVELDNAVSEFSKLDNQFEVLDLPKTFGRQKSLRVSIRLKSANMAGQQVEFAARGELRGGQELEVVQPQSDYRCFMELRPTAAGERAGFVGHCKGDLQLLRKSAEHNWLVSKVRTAFLENSRGVTPDARGLVAGLAIGDTSLLSEKLKLDMKTVSLTHLTAVSGANCAIVLAMVYLLIRRIGGGRWLRLIAGLLTLIAYVALVGAQPSVLRAAVMAAVVLVAISLGRKTAPLNGLGLSVMLLLIADPWLAVDFGFALSVAATAGLLILTEPIARRLAVKLPQWLAVSLAVAISAQIFCLPILLQLQTGLATYSLPANLLAESLVAPVTILGILAVLVALPLPWLAQLLSFTASFGTQWIAQIAEYFAGLPRGSLSWPTGTAGAVAAMAVIFGFLLWLKAEPHRLRSLGLTSLALILAVSIGSIAFVEVRSATWPMRNWSVVACDVGQGDALVVRSSGRVAVIDVGKEDKLVGNCLTQLGIKTIDLLVLTHFDMDHVGGIRGALEGRSVGTVLVSPFKDDRWGATGTNHYLSKTGAKIIVVEKGVSGVLGHISWQVLSPMRAAAGAQDSNDASIVILWKSPLFNLLTMADLGERGQMRMSLSGPWLKDPALHSVPLVLKVSHHGSADQFPGLIEALGPDLSLISVGKGNSYGHPTDKTLSLLGRVGSRVFRTDGLGDIALSADASGLVMSNSPHS